MPQSCSFQVLADGTTSMPAALAAVFFTAMFEIAILCVPLVTCGGPATTARSCAPALFSLYSRATCWAICVAIWPVVPLSGFQSDQPFAETLPLPELGFATRTTSPTIAAIPMAARPP